MECKQKYLSIIMMMKKIKINKNKIYLMNYNIKL